MFSSDDESDDSESVTTNIDPIHHPPPSIRLLSKDPRHATEVKVKIQSPRTGTICAGTTLLDSGATGMFMDPTFAKENSLDICPLPRPIPVYNVDGTLNKMGSVHEEVEVILQIDDHSEWVVFSVIRLGKTKLIIGHTWLHHHNPEIDWELGKITLTRCPSNCCVTIRKLQNAECQKGRKGRNAAEKPMEDPPPLEEIVEEPLEKGDAIFAAYFPNNSEHSEIIWVISTPSQQLAEAAKANKLTKTFEELVLDEFQDFRDVFSKDSFDQLPQWKPWDHHIEFKKEPSSLPQPNSSHYPQASRRNSMTSWRRTLPLVAFTLRNLLWLLWCSL
jgi:hypothetical protein